MEINWIATNNKRLPQDKQRLLLIVSAAGSPPDARLIGKSDVVVGYWTGDAFRPMTVDHNDLGTELDVSHWAFIGPLLPTDVELRHLRMLDEDVRS